MLAYGTKDGTKQDELAEPHIGREAREVRTCSEKVAPVDPTSHGPVLMFLRGLQLFVVVLALEVVKNM